LKFKRPLEKCAESWHSSSGMRRGIMTHAVARQKGSLSARFAAKLVIDVLPAAAASLIGTFLISQYQFQHHKTIARLPLEQAGPASAEMMQLVRDEHAAMMGYLKAEMAAQQHRHAIEDEAEARAVAEAKATQAQPARTAAAPAAVTTVAPTLVSARTAVIMAAPSRQPLVLTRTDQNTAAAVAPSIPAQPAAPAAQPKSLIDATLDVKDHVVDTTLHVTWHAVSAIGSLPSWLASFGSRIGGSNADANAARLRAS
jgi:hypothetical protein